MNKRANVLIHVDSESHDPTIQPQKVVFFSLPDWLWTPRHNDGAVTLRGALSVTLCTNRKDRAFNNWLRYENMGRLPQTVHLPSF